MPTSLPIVDGSQKPHLRPAVRKLPRARGTNTSLIEDRSIRLHHRGERPWRGREDDHRDKVNVERHGDGYVVFKPSVGALSAMRKREYIAFNVFLATNGDHEAMARSYAQMGAPVDLARRKAKSLAAKFEAEGWLRTEAPLEDGAPLQSVYFTVTRWCDRGCPYCYQGLNDRNGTDMTFDQAKLTLERIKAVNPNCMLTVTGGEPLSHNRIFDILDLMSEMGFRMHIITNGTYLDDKAAQYFKNLKALTYVQISLDGFTAETHEITRGKGHHAKVMAAIHRVAEHGVPFKLAPTLHKGNIHELKLISELAIQLDGGMSPNPLKELPHAGLDYTVVNLTNDQLHQALDDANDYIVEKYGLAAMKRQQSRYKNLEPDVCSVIKANSTFICGMAHSLMDIDWNGDVYPCHLNKGPEFVLGNIFEEDFDVIFQRVEERELRVKSNEIEQCSGCKFGSTCAGGCRAGAYFTYATMEHPDECCSVSYDTRLENLLAAARIE